MSSRDYGQKLEMRRVLWAMGASTRVEVKLSALVPRGQGRSRAAAEEWTDLDVLGVQYVPMHGLSYAVADCKTARGRVTERVFWLRGVADLFGARAAYLVRDAALPPSARQLALRLGITAMDADDRAALIAQVENGSIPVDAPFFSADGVARWSHLADETPRAIERLQRYRRTFFWLLPRHRNLTQLPAYLQADAKHFLTDQRWSLVVLTDLAWLYLLAILDAVDSATRLHLSDPSVALPQVVVGSEPELREKEQLARQLRALIEHVDARRAADIPAVPVLPAYFAELSDLVARVARRRLVATDALRALEFVAVETIANGGRSWAEATEGRAALGAKLASDTVRFLIRACGLDPWFVEGFDAAVRGQILRPSRSAARSAPKASPGLFDAVLASADTPATTEASSESRMSGAEADRETSARRGKTSSINEPLPGIDSTQHDAD